MTSEDRVNSLHARLKALRRVQERRKTRLIGAAGAVLTVCLALMVFGSGGFCAGGSAGLYSGAMMLFENAGGYVLAAITAFTAGVVLTVVLLKKKKKEEEKLKEKEERFCHSKEENHGENDR